jgi:malonyl-CoA/methylmalonyl-CoA synthetase
MTQHNLYALIRNRLPLDLGKPCIETPDGCVWSFSDLDRGTARLAGWLASLYPWRNARVVAQVEKSPEALMLYLATLRAGLVHVPLNTAYQKAELSHFLADAQPTVFVCTPQRHDELAPLARGFGCRHVMTLGEARDGTLLEAAAPFPDVFPIVVRQDDDLAAILYTSGTTGRSKGAMLTHGNLSSNARVLDEFWGFASQRESGRPDVLLHALPLFHVHGLFVAAHAALMAGARMLFLPRFDAAQTLAWLPRATVFMGVPTYYSRLLAEPGLTRRACANLRLCVSGSAPLLPETFVAFQQRTGHTILERYGMSETVMLTSNPYFGEPGERISGTVGMPLPGVSVRVVGDAGDACAPGVTGHVQVRGPSVFPGYWRLPSVTREAFTTDGWFRTGDLGVLGGAGRPPTYLTLVGRSRDLVICGGYNVYPKEVELHLDAFEGVSESAVIGLPHPDFGEAVVAVVVPRPGARIDARELIDAMKALIANFKVPKRVFVVDALPRNAMGKVQKNVLRERYIGTFTDPAPTR